MSYTQSVKEGENPPPYTPAYENVLAKAGIFMHQHLSQAPISNTCQELCATLLDGEYNSLNILFSRMTCFGLPWKAFAGGTRREL